MVPPATILEPAAGRINGHLRERPSTAAGGKLDDRGATMDPTLTGRALAAMTKGEPQVR
jgi:hypothetical protein